MYCSRRLVKKLKGKSSRKLQEYAKKAFDDVADNYDEIPFFKISAKNVLKIIRKYKTKDDVNILDVACGTGNVVLECATCMSNANFDAVDMAEGMLEKARNNAGLQNLDHIDFHLQYQ